MAGEQLVDGVQAAALGHVEQARVQAGHANHTALYVVGDDGQVLAADYLGRDFLA